MKKGKKYLMSKLELALTLCEQILRQGNITKEREELLKEVLERLREIEKRLANQEEDSASKWHLPETAIAISANIGKIVELILEFFRN